MGLTISSAQNADTFVFTGGEDISPSIYKEKSIVKNRPFLKNIPSPRDSLEMSMFHKFPHKNKIGICRGAQLLFVLNGGTLWQNVNNHSDNHDIFLKDNSSVCVTSTHHQMMKEHPNKTNPYITRGWSYLTTKYESDGCTLSYMSCDKPFKSNSKDLEIVWFPKTNTLCFQPHPEYSIFTKAHDSALNTGLLFLEEIDELFPNSLT